MALSAFRVVRAVAASQAQTWLNTSFRNAGLGASTLSIIFISAALLTFTSSLAGMGGLISFLAMKQGEVRVVGLGFTMIPLMGAFMSAVTGDASGFDWPSLRRFPTTLRWLYLAELATAFAHPMMLIFVVTQLAMALGALLASPASAPYLVLTLAAGLSAQVTLRLLMGAFMQQVIANSRRLLMGLLLLCTVLGWRWLSKAESAISLPALAESFERLGEAGSTYLELLAESLPPTAMLLAQSRTGWSWFFSLAGPLLMIAALGVLAVRFAAREGQGGGSVSDGKPERLWSFRNRVVGLARLQWLTLWRSDLGRAALLTPLFALWPFVLLARGAGAVVAKLPIDAASFMSLSIWVVGSLSSTNLLMNQFGLDRGAVRALFLMPVTSVELIRGKALGYGVFQALQMLPVLLVARFAMHSSWRLTIAGVLVAFILFLVQLTVGQWTSVVWPRAIPHKGLRQPPGSLVSISLTLFVSAASMLPLSAVWVVTSALWPVGLVPVLLLLAVIAVVVQLFGAKQAARVLTMRRERLIESLS